MTFHKAFIYNQQKNSFIIICAKPPIMTYKCYQYTSYKRFPVSIRLQYFGVIIKQINVPAFVKMIHVCCNKTYRKVTERLERRPNVW